jgi:DNA anti-recombination protein RmuC
VQRQLQTATKTIEETGTRTRAMERKLRSVEQLGPAESATILRLPGVPAIESAEESETDDPSQGQAALSDDIDSEEAEMTETI